MDSKAFKVWLTDEGPKNAHVRSDIMSRCRRVESLYAIDLDNIKTVGGAQELDRDIYLNASKIFPRAKDISGARHKIRAALVYYWSFRKIPFEPSASALSPQTPSTPPPRKPSRRV